MNKEEALKILDESFVMDEDYQKIPKEFWSNKDFVLEAVKKQGAAINYADPALKNNKEIVISAIKQDSFAIDYIGEEIKKDKDVLLEIIAQKGVDSIKLIDEKYKSDKEVILKLLHSKKDSILLSLDGDEEPDPIKFMSKEFLKDEQVLELALQNQWLELDKVDSQLITKNIAKAAMKKKENFDKLEDKFKNDPNIILEALRHEDTWGDSEIFSKIDESLKTNKEFLVKAVNIKDSIFDQISDDLKKDKAIVLSAVSKNGFVLNKIDESFTKDKTVVLAAVNQSGASLMHADDTMKKDREVVLAAIKNHTSGHYIDYLDKSFIEDKKFVLQALRYNKNFLILFRDYREIIEKLVEDNEIFNLIKKGEVRGKLNSGKLHECIKSQLSDFELICLTWSGGGDDFHGYKLLYGKKVNSQISKIDINENKKKFIEKLIDDSTIVEEMNLELGSAGAYFSNGGLVLALNPLKERFQWNITTNTNAEFNELNEHDSVLATINLQKDFIGLSLSGENGEEVGFDEENEEYQYEKTPVGNEIEI